MKSFRRYLSVFFCCLVLFGVFSISVSAETVETKPYNIKQTIYVVPSDGSGVYNMGSKEFTPNDGDEMSYEVFSDMPYQKFNGMMFQTNYNYKYQDESVILKSGKTYKITLNNIYFSYLIGDIPNFYVREPSNTIITLRYIDGSKMVVEDYNLTQKANTPNLNYIFECSPEKDVVQIEISVVAECPPINTATGLVRLTSYFGEFSGDSKYQFTMEVETQEAGLLKTVIEWLKGIKNGIADLFQSIAELPSKLWNLIETGLKNLFVPDEQYMSGYSNKWDELLSQRFGAIYDVGTIITDFVGQIQASDKTNTIHIPVADLSGVGIPFSFGGYDVKIVPDGFGVLVEICKKIISIACTFLFVNGLRKRYDEVMGVEQ